MRTGQRKTIHSRWKPNSSAMLTLMMRDVYKRQVLITKGVNPILTLLVTFAAGAFAGMLTGIIHVKLKVRDLLSGIIMMTALYTVNLRIAGRANLPIYNMTTLFDNDFVRNVFKGGLAQFSNVIIIPVSYTHLDVYKRQG